MGPGCFGWNGMWIIPMIICIVMVIVCFRFFGRGCFRPPWLQDSDKNQSDSTGSETAMDILKKRYAKGEITKEEFDQMKKDLQIGSSKLDDCKGNINEEP